MDVAQCILDDFSKENALFIVNWIGKDEKRFEQLFELLYTDSRDLTMRSSWIMTHMLKPAPELLIANRVRMAKHLRDDAPNSSVKRSLLKILSETPMTEELAEILLDFCFDALLSTEEPIAVHVFAMTALYNISELYPELKRELYDAIAMKMPEGSGGIKSRGGKLMAKLEKQIDI